MRPPAERFTRVQIPAPASRYIYFSAVVLPVMHASREIASGIVYRDDEYLTLDRKPDDTMFIPDFVTGSREGEDSTSLKTMTRELREETSFMPEDVDGLKRFQSYIFEGWGRRYLVHPFCIEVSSGNPEVSSEHGGYWWMDEEDIERQYEMDFLTPDRYFNYRWVKEGMEDRDGLQNMSSSELPEVSEDMLEDRDIDEIIDKIVEDT
jgi:8-oxo-dGTP pyrophosphatase MutT (NUDIX family)